MPLQTPAWQVSLCVQALPSLQAAPSGLTGFEQAPVCGSHVPASWQASGAAQVTAFPPVQTPAEHVSVRVQALPSSQAVPFGFCGFEHVPVCGSQVPGAWH